MQSQKIKPKNRSNINQQLFSNDLLGAEARMN